MTKFEKIRTMTESYLASFLAWVRQDVGAVAPKSFEDEVYTASCKMCPKRKECHEDTSGDCLMETSAEEDIRRWLASEAITKSEQTDCPWK